LSLWRVIGPRRVAETMDRPAAPSAMRKGSVKMRSAKDFVDDFA